MRYSSVGRLLVCGLFVACAGCRTKPLTPAEPVQCPIDLEPRLRGAPIGFAYVQQPGDVLKPISSIEQVAYPYRDRTAVLCGPVTPSDMPKHAIPQIPGIDAVSHVGPLCRLDHDDPDPPSSSWMAFCQLNTAVTRQGPPVTN
jgi:hypothetical protein